MLIRLKVLNLSDNPIPVLADNSFKDLKSLEQLDLNQMKHLVDVLAYTFSDQINLTHLNMSDNPHLYYMDRYAFYGLHEKANNRTQFKLKEVNLRNNRLTTIGNLTF